MSAPRILVVDDDPPVRRMLDRTLAADGYDVAVAADGGRALALLERRVPDLVVLDVAMPGLDGIAVCRRIRAKGLDVGILLLTARDAMADRVVGLDAGADDYLVKPFAPDELTARVRDGSGARARSASGSPWPPPEPSCSRSRRSPSRSRCSSRASGTGR